MKNLILSLICFFFLFPVLLAQEKGFTFNWKKDGLLLGGGLASILVGEQTKINAGTLTLDEINALDANNINTFDRRATRQNRLQDARVSDFILGIGAISPLVTLSDNVARKDVIPIIAMYVETALIVNGITNISKGLSKRIRPFVYNPNSSMDKTTLNARQSFFSGHVSNAAAFSFLTASIINEYTENRKVKNIAWIGASVIPATVGVLRYTSGRHFPTDILTGYLVGSGIGLLIPYLHRKRPTSDKTDKLSFNLSGNSFVFSYTF